MFYTEGWKVSEEWGAGEEVVDAASIWGGADSGVGFLLGKVEPERICEVEVTESWPIIVGGGCCIQGMVEGAIPISPQHQ